RRFAFSHVGLYLGDDQFIHAPRRGREVEITTISAAYWQTHFNGARRLVGELPALIPDVIPSAAAATSPTSPMGIRKEALQPDSAITDAVDSGTDAAAP
ncbi:MAG TPA: NlpC/P60 family protein, partial [Casimicrobiaceae bacterium]|nr:NlpC/P60 family protein [Casimicrobiaceae bacterium]